MPEMPAGDKITLVIPVYNNERILRTSYRSLATFFNERVNDFELIFVNDGSTDRCGAILEELAKADVRVRVRYFTSNHGQQTAIGAGLELVTSGTAITTDIDLPVALDDLLALERKLHEGYELVMGKRRRCNHTKAYRRWGSRLVNFGVRILYLNRITDFGCSSAAISAPLLARFRNDPIPRWSMKLALVMLTGKFCEMPLRIVEKENAQSAYSFRKLMFLALSILAYRILKYPLMIRSAAQRKSRLRQNSSNS